MAQAKKPACELPAIKTPVMDGTSALRALGSNGETQILSTVIMTTNPGLLDASQLVTLALGVAALLRKLLTPEDLGATIDQGLTGVQAGQRGAQSRAQCGISPLCGSSGATRDNRIYL